MTVYQPLKMNQSGSQMLFDESQTQGAFEESETQATNQKKNFTWKFCHDADLIAQILADRPFEATRGNVTQAWENLAEALNKIAKFQKMATSRACKERMGKLVKEFRQKEAANLWRSGTEQERNALYRRLQELTNLLSENEGSNEKGEGKEKAKANTKAMRDQAMSRFKERIGRSDKASENASESENENASENEGERGQKRREQKEKEKERQKQKANTNAKEKRDYHDDPDDEEETLEIKRTPKKAKLDQALTTYLDARARKLQNINEDQGTLMQKRLQEERERNEAAGREERERVRKEERGKRTD